MTKASQFTVIEEQLHKVQQNERRKEGVQVDVERVAPLDVGIDLAAPQVPVGHEPHECGHNYAA